MKIKKFKYIYLFISLSLWVLWVSLGFLNNYRAPDDFGFFLDICEGLAFPTRLLASSETRDDDTKQQRWPKRVSF